MAIQNKIALETRFQLNNDPRNFRLQDISDYASEGIATSDVIGYFVIKDPNGDTVHSGNFGSPDIDLDVQDYIDTIALPTDANDEVLKGNYTIEYNIRVSGAVQPGDYVETFVYKFCYEDIEMDIDLTFDLICAKVTSTDNTSYPDEVTTTNRTHTVHPPAGLDPVEWPVQTVTTKNNIYSKDGNKIATKTWTGKVVNILELTYTDGLIVDVTVTGNSEREVVDDINLCNLQCNARALYERYFSALGSNTANADIIYRDQVAPTLFGSFMYTSNIQCGNFDKAEEYYQDVLKFTGSQPDCQCSDSDEPQIIEASCIGGGGSGQVYVVEACGTNNAITVTANTVGDTTTYTVCFNQDLFNKLNLLKNDTISSPDNSIIVTPVINGDDVDWQITVNPAASGASPVHSFTGIMEIDLDPTNPPTLGWDADYSDVVGNKLQEPAINNTNSTNPDWANLQNCFYLDDYVDQSGGEFPVPTMQIVETLNTKDQSQDPCRYLRTLFVQIVQIDEAQNRIYFQFLDRNYALQAVPGNVLSESYGKIRVAVKLNA